MIIDVILGGKTVFNDGIPSVIGGYPSVMDTTDLELKTSLIDNENERTEATEYWLDGELVHRSVNMFLKKAIFGDGFSASFA